MTMGVGAVTEGVNHAVRLHAARDFPSQGKHRAVPWFNSYCTALFHQHSIVTAPPQALTLSLRWPDRPTIYLRWSSLVPEGFLTGQLLQKL